MFLPRNTKLAVAMASLLFTACSTPDKDSAPSPQAANTTDSTAVATVKKDSAAALNFNSLKQLLPQKLADYAARDTAGGETLSNATSGGKQSYARREYFKNNKSMVIEIVDYSMARKTLNDLVQMYTRNIAANKPNEILKEEPCNNRGIKIFSQLNINDNYQKLFITVNDRYAININGNDETSVPFLLKIFNSISTKEVLQAGVSNKN